MIKGVIFDFYETLVEIDQKAPEAWELLNSLGYKSSKSYQSNFEANAFDGQLTPRLNETPGYSDWLKSNYMELARLSGVPSDKMEEIAEMILNNEKRWTFKSKPHARELIEICQNKGLSVGICSNWDFPLEEYLKQAGLPDFENKSISCIVGARKPHKLIFNDILGKTGLKPSEALFVGDGWESDIVGCLKMGIRAIWLKNKRPEKIVSRESILQMDSLSEVCEYLKKSFLIF